MIKKSFYIETYGCASNKADSNIISNLLIDSNYVRTSLSNAQFVIVNTCGVKQQTENKIKRRLGTLYERYKGSLNKYLIITGCLPHIAATYIKVIENLVPNFGAIIDLNNIHEIPKILNEVKGGKRNIIVKSAQPIDKSQFQIHYPQGKITGIIPISEGCLGACTYCCVKNARGQLYCYNPLSILNNVKSQLKQGIKQIYLTSQDCSTYKYAKTNLAELIGNIANLKEKFYLRLGMINPRFLVDELDQLIMIFNYDKVYKLFHMPIQSGSDDVLQKMNRTYRIKPVIENLKKLKEKVPNLSFSTDIICGFPGETESDFNKTIQLVKSLKPEILNISKFTPRPGTKAKVMKQINSKIIKERSMKLSDIFRESLINSNLEWEGWEGEVLVLHPGEEPNQAFGRNIAYKNVFIEEYSRDFGEFVKVKINKVEGFNLFALNSL
ncbi:MAG: tRNA (N(6)-L-threonylcarbamoyladenosine(37)-C(2))-methylthiotransferase [Promethearchaeota archaeon]|nr:MAG: tRNA (N(6)-L-threonylcarbamoyladenosine(37)-C(2))-methylthiotransferase [Candidatus Lokiarchaeota archaeon]